MSTDTQLIVKPERKETELKPFTNMQLLNFCLGFFGLQFAWQMRIILSGPVTEGLGASPFIFGLIWLAGPVTGMVVQPIIGAMSDKTQTIFGRRRPFLLLGALIASLSLWAFPNSLDITNFFGSTFNLGLPVWSALFLAAIFIWLIDGSVNAAQGPYRALVPDNMPQEQHAIANSYLSFAIGLGSVIAAGTAPFLKWAFDYNMSIKAQFLMAALAFSLMTIWTCITTKERTIAVDNDKKDETPQEQGMGFFETLSALFKASPEVTKVCMIQFFSWLGIMSMFIFFTQFAIHTVYGVPDLANATDDVKMLYDEANLLGANLSSTSFAVFNLICFIVSIPIGILSSRYGNKNVHAIALITMALAFIGMTFTVNIKAITVLMGLAGIGWASVLALPFAIFSQYIPKGTEGSAMGIFNLFIAGPQVLVCTLLAWFISQCPTAAGNNYHWEYAFVVGGIALFIAALITMTVKEKQA
ncbi:MAG: SLC45 family MFS transporter [Candidatus Gastranaerophilales bacterium]|nr:SLC45 family MFS transporter [Candidatus Gastranaerophilales bacterium]